MRTPPKKQKGWGRGPRRIDGACLDVRGGSLFFGWSEKKTRGLVARRIIPFHKINGRIIFLRVELEQWLVGLGGVTVGEAIQNMQSRQG